MPWGDAIEDFLDAIGISLDAFCQGMTGGWLFGYVEALRQAGWRSVIVCVSRNVTEVQRRPHPPTGASFLILPLPRAYPRGMVAPYAASAEAAFGVARASLRQRAAWQAAPFLATPLPTLLRELRREQCDAILVQEYETGRFDLAVLAGALLRLPVCASFQGGDRHYRRLEGLTRRLSLRFAQGLVIASAAEAERVQRRYGVPAAKIARIANPLDLSLWFPEDRAAARAALGLPAEAPVVIWHGRVDIRRKGLDLLLAAWARLRPHFPTARLLLVGTGADAAALRPLLDASVDWRDRYILDRAEMRRLLSAADLYVLPSRHEGFPVAPLEAMACGLPVVAAAAPGVPEILEGGEASGGLLVPLEDSAALATAMQRLLEDAALRQRLGAAARRRVLARFGFDAIGRALDAMLAPTAAHAQQPLPARP